MSKAVPSKPPQATTPHAYVLTTTSRVPGLASPSRSRGPVVEDATEAESAVVEGTPSDFAGPCALR